eukprot:scaffold732_cov114-Cylindrotheca_fusiformis.AAC.4
MNPESSNACWHESADGSGQFSDHMAKKCTYFISIRMDRPYAPSCRISMNDMMVSYLKNALNEQYRLDGEAIRWYVTR